MDIITTPADGAKDRYNVAREMCELLADIRDEALPPGSLWAEEINAVLKLYDLAYGAPDTLNGVEYELLERRTRYPFPEQQRVRVNGVEAWYTWAGIEWLLCRFGG